MDLDDNGRFEIFNWEGRAHHWFELEDVVLAHTCTGGSRGLGRNAALKLAQKGIRVVITYKTRESDALECIKEIEALDMKAAAVQLDISSMESVRGFAEAFLKILQAQWGVCKFDYLVNNAGHGIHKPFAEITEDDFDGLVNAHFKGVFFLTQSLVPHLSDGGKILNVSTGLTRFCIPGYAAYASVKGAVEILTKCLAKELGYRGISVNCLAPGAIATDFGGGAEHLNNLLASQTALQRVGDADDVGDMISALLSDETRWMNAQRIEASGGMFL